MSPEQRSRLRLVSVTAFLTVIATLFGMAVVAAVAADAPTRRSENDLRDPVPDSRL